VALASGDEIGAAWTNPIWEQIRDRRDLADGMFAWGTDRFNLADGGEARPVNAVIASGRYFDVLGVPPALGRLLQESDDRRGGGASGPVVVLSHGFWQRHFGGAPDVVGRTLPLDGVPFTIVGVAPATFTGTDVGVAVDVFVPLGTEPLLRTESALDHRSYWWLGIMARLKAGQTLEEANRDFRSVQAQVRAATIPGNWPSDLLKEYLRDPFTVVSAATGDSFLRQRYQKPLVALMVIVFLVLLIACANIANLLLVRATARSHETSIRLALGATRWQILRQHLAESLILSAAGAGLGLLLARWGAAMLVGQIGRQRATVFLDLSIDWRVLAFTTATTVFTVLLFGSIPALRATRVRATDSLKDEGRGVAGDRRFAASGMMLVAQVALSLVLVVAAGLFTRTFTTLAGRSLGFERERMVVVNVDGERAYSDLTQMPAALERARQSVASLPGVSAAAVSVVTPIGGFNWMFSVQVNDQVPTAEQLKSVYVNYVSPGWFATYRTPILMGRDIEATDQQGTAPVVLVNQAFVRSHIGSRNPLGLQLKRAREPKPTPPATIVGVVQDAVYRNLRDPAPPTIYYPFAQVGRPVPTARLTFRAADAASERLNQDVARAVTGVNPRLSLTFHSLSRQVSDSLAQEQLLAMLSGFFGLLALFLAGLGLYGVAAYSVARRRAEIGIRMALGASPLRVVGTTLGRLGLFVGLGLLVGTGVAVWASRFAKALVFGLEPRDPVTLVGAVGILALVGMLAGWLPARRAAAVDPARVLRDI
jgi:predicted permease